MNNVPAAKTKSAPNTMSNEEGNPKAQYEEDGLMTAKNKFETPVNNVPLAS